MGIQNPQTINLSLPKRPDGVLDSAFDTTGLIIINGSGFGTKSTPAPAINENFSSYATDERLQDENPLWAEYNGNGGAPVKAVGRYAGAKSAYHDYSLSEFATNYQTVNPVHNNLEQEFFASYWVQIINWIDNKDYGANKFCRITSTTANGGGGVYNETGVHALQYPNSDGYSSCSYGPNNPQSPNWASRNSSHNGQWFRVQHSMKIVPVGSSAGYYRTQAGAQNYSLENLESRPQGTLWSAGTYPFGTQRSMVKPAGANAGVIHYLTVSAVGGTSAAPFDGSGNVGTGWRVYGRQNFLVDTVLLGLEQANPRRYFYVNTITPNTDYTAQIEGGPLVTYNSGPTPTANSIVTGLRDAIVAAGYVATLYGDSIAGNPTVNKATFDNKFTLDMDLSPRWHVTDVYFDYGRKQIIFADNAVWASRTKTKDETQPWRYWYDNSIGVEPNMTNFATRNCYAFIYDGDTDTGTLLGQVVPKSGGGWEVV